MCLCMLGGDVLLVFVCVGRRCIVSVGVWGGGGGFVVSVCVCWEEDVLLVCVCVGIGGSVHVCFCVNE